MVGWVVVVGWLVVGLPKLLVVVEVWLDQVGIRLSQLSTKLKLKLKLSLAKFGTSVPIRSHLGY